MRHAKCVRYVRHGISMLKFFRPQPTSQPHGLVQPLLDRGGAPLFSWRGPDTEVPILLAHFPNQNSGYNSQSQQNHGSG